MRKVLLFSTILLVLVMYGCNNESTSPEEENPASSYEPIPLAVGNYWVYMDVEDSTKVDTTKVVAQTTYEGKQAYKMVSSSSMDTVIAFYDGGYLKAVSTFYLPEEDSGFVAEVNLLKVPLVVGESWTVLEFDTTKTDTSTGLTTTFSYNIISEVLGVEDVSVPAGDFPGCFKVKTLGILTATVSGNGFQTTWTDTLINSYTYIKDGIGSCKTEDEENGESVLIDYLVQ